MPRKLEAYTEEILAAIDDIKSFASGLDFDTYSKDERTKAAVERKLLVVGEALNQMNKSRPGMEGQITDFKKIVSFRNVLVHSYFGIDDRIVWDALTTKLDQLRLEIEKLN